MGRTNDVKICRYLQIYILLKLFSLTKNILNIIFNIKIIKKKILFLKQLNINLYKQLSHYKIQLLNNSLY